MTNRQLKTKNNKTCQRRKIMKKIAALIILLASSPITLLSMDLVRQLSPKRKRSQELVSVESMIIKEAVKTVSTPNLLLLAYRAKKDYNLTPLHIAHYALAQEKHEDAHDKIFIQMNRIATYNATIAAKNKLCPVIHFHNNFDTIMLLYKEYREVRIRANQCGLFISKSQQLQATPFPIEIEPNIAFEEYVDLELDLYELHMNPIDWQKIVTMLKAKSIKTSSSLIILDSEDESRTK